MENSTKVLILKETNLYFAPEQKIPQLLNKIEQLQQGSGNGIKTGANVAGGVTKGIFTGISILTTMMGAAAGVNTRGLTKAFDASGDLLNKGIKAGGNAADNAAVRSQIQSITDEIQKIQSGNVNRGITDEDMDGNAMDLVPENLYEMALYKLNLDESQISEVDPVYFEDYYIDEDNENQCRATGRDGVVRTPEYRATWLFGTPNKLCIYRCIIDLLQGSYTEIDDAYFWKNITKLSNSTRIVNGKSKSYFEIKGANFEYKFVYQDNPEINQTIRGLKSYYNMKNQ